MFSKDDFRTIKNLSTDPSIYITKPDKGNGVVILNIREYISKMENTLSDPTKFQKIVDDERKLTIRLEDKVNNALRTLKGKGSINEDFYKRAFISGSQLGSMYGLPKVHKPNVPVRPILSACNTHNFKLGKQLVPILSHLAANEYTLNNSYEFCTLMQQFPDADTYFMCSFDVESLYTNVPLAETINIVLDRLFEEGPDSIFNGFSRSDFRKLLQLSLQDTYFKFNNSVYKQVDGLAMGSSVSPIIANIFLNHFETVHLNSCPPEIKPTLYRRYLDDTFILFRSEMQARAFFDYFSEKHDSIKFTIETEQNESLSFLDVKVTKQNNKFITSVYRKATFTGLGTNYFSCINEVYKVSCIRTLIHRAFKICSSYQSFHEEVEFLKTFFTNNNFPMKLINKVIKHFLNKQFDPRQTVIGAPKQKIFFELPYIGSQTTKLTSEVISVLGKIFPQILPCFYFRSTCTIGQLFKKKDTPDQMLRTSVVYKYDCHCCQRCYIGSTSLQMFRRCAQHQGVSFRTGQHLTKPDKSSIRDHCMQHDHPFKLANFSIVDSTFDSQDIKILESIHIHCSKPTLNDYARASGLFIVS